MAKEKDDARYEALAHAFDEIRAERDQAAHRVEELTKRPAVVTVAVSPEEKVDALMLAIDELAAVTADETARQRIRPLVLQLGIWIGLDFEGYTRGKRPLRRVRRGVIAFGQENLPVRVHGAQHVAVEEAVPAAPPPRRLATRPVRRLDLIAAEPATAAHDDHGVSLDTPHDKQGAPACCLGPSVEPGAEGGDGTGDGRTDETISGMVQFRTVSNVGATRFEQQPILSGKPGNVIPGGAECGALPADSAASTPDAGLAGGADPLLALVIQAWPTLTAEDRLAVVERIATKLCASGAEPLRRAAESAPSSGETNFRRRGTRTAPRRD